MLHVIGGSFGRTGTHSLATALEILGFGPCYHMRSWQQNPNHLAEWQRALNGAAVDWIELFAGYQSAVEWPAVAFFPEIAAAFPDAKVILTLRDAESWFESANATIFDGLELSAYNPNPKRSIGGQVARAIVLERTFHGRHRDKSYATAVYQRHLEQVRDLIPQRRRLEFNITDGWAPLCAFLGVDVPAEPFPRKHVRDVFMQGEPEWAREARKKWLK